MVDENAHAIFQILHLDYQWLQHPVEEWQEQQEFRVIEDVVKGLEVVNDDAEHGCHLATSHGGIITKDEENQQGVFQSVTLCCKLAPIVTKTNITSMKLSTQI